MTTSIYVHPFIRSKRWPHGRTQGILSKAQQDASDETTLIQVMTKTDLSCKPLSSVSVWGANEYERASSLKSLDRSTPQVNLLIFVCPETRYVSMQASYTYIDIIRVIDNRPGMSYKLQYVALKM